MNFNGLKLKLKSNLGRPLFAEAVPSGYFPFQDSFLAK